VSIARGLERRLERLFEGSARRVFSGRIHPSELAERIAREADLARYEHLTGPATANRYVVALNPRDLQADPAPLQAELERALADYAADSGLRLEGPPSIILEPVERVPAGQAHCTHQIKPGPFQPWARLVGKVILPIGPNRALIGRSDEADVMIPTQEVSRRHALLYRIHGQTWIVDLGSANGTRVDSTPVGGEDVRVDHGAMVTFATASFRFLEI
jgi:hypothetical protein